VNILLPLKKRAFRRITDPHAIVTTTKLPRILNAYLLYACLLNLLYRGRYPPRYSYNYSVYTKFVRIAIELGVKTVKPFSSRQLLSRVNTIKRNAAVVTCGAHSSYIFKYIYLSNPHTHTYIYTDTYAAAARTQSFETITENFTAHIIIFLNYSCVIARGLEIEFLHRPTATENPSTTPYNLTTPNLAAYKARVWPAVAVVV